MFRSILSALEELTLLVLPHGGQRTARRNAWRAATDLHVTSGYRWIDTFTTPPSITPASITPAPTTPATAAPTSSRHASTTPTSGASARPAPPAPPAITPLSPAVLARTGHPDRRHAAVSSASAGDPVPSLSAVSDELVSPPSRVAAGSRS